MSDCKHAGEDFEHDNYEEGACSQCGMSEANIAWAKVAKLEAKVQSLLWELADYEARGEE